MPIDEAIVDGIGPTERSWHSPKSRPFASDGNQNKCRLAVRGHDEILATDFRSVASENHIFETDWKSVERPRRCRLSIDDSLSELPRSFAERKATMQR
jgi:hypothetical protein